ncbi:(-)-germacrene d synthase [Quercus suber]|uniref:(-)-germacrene d synthase n=1 Tax=Quercus suber TaxID=58331 RepID=A0AAW0J6D2_QUESU
MSLQVSAVPAQTKNPNSNKKRPLVNYSPSLWETTSSLMLMTPCKFKVEGRSGEVANGSKINLHKNHHNEVGQEDNGSLYTIALRFRLLRQQGYNIPSGMLHLYEATHMRVCGEDILDEALKFTTTYLKSVVTNLNPTLEHNTYSKVLAKVEARHYFSTYHENASHNEVLLKFAKLDFNILKNNTKRNLVISQGIDRVVSVLLDFGGVGYQLLDQIPEYMKLCYKALWMFMKKLRMRCPRKEDHTFYNHIFCGVGDIVTQEAFEWVSQEPKIVKAASTISRLMDDIVSQEVHKRLVITATQL